MLAICTTDKCYVNDLLNSFKYVKDKNCSLYSVYKCLYNSHEFLIVVTGYGKVNIGSSLMYIRENYKIGCIISIGTCGCVVQNKNLFDIVIPNGTIQYDVDFLLRNCMVSKIPNVKKNKYITNSDLNNCLKSSCLLLNENYLNEAIASADMYVYNKYLARSIKRSFNIDVVDVDSGCVGEFCYLNNIAYSCIKVISYNAFYITIKKYNYYDSKASNKCQRIVYKFIKEFYNE